MNNIYQVVVTDKYNKRIQHIGIFRFHADAIACMKSVVPSKDCTTEVWQHSLYEGAWDGMSNVKENLAYSLMKDNNE